MTHAERIRYLRLTIGMSIRDLAERSGVDRLTVTRAEAGQEPVRPESAARILETLEKIATEVGLDLSSDVGPTVEMVIFGVLADYTSDMDWIDEAGAKLATALRESGLLR
jgi:transcriptional regulator with XRE-family HTH domain